MTAAPTGLGEAIRRPSDGELVGFVLEQPAGRWVATTVFGAVLESFGCEDDARRYLVEHGLSVLSGHWWLWSPEQARWRRATLVEAGVGWVRVRCGLDPRSTDVRLLRSDDVHLLHRGGQPPEADQSSSTPLPSGRSSGST